MWSSLGSKVGRLVDEVDAGLLRDLLEVEAVAGERVGRVPLVIGRLHAACRLSAAHRRERRDEQRTSRRAQADLAAVGSRLDGCHVRRLSDARRLKPCTNRVGRDVTGVVRLPVLADAADTPGRLPARPRRRSRRRPARSCDGSGSTVFENAGVVVAVLLPAVADQHEVAAPARGAAAGAGNRSRISSPAFMIT